MSNQIEKENYKVDILGVYFDNVTIVNMIENIKVFFESSENRNLWIVTANPEIVDYASEHVDYKNLINQSDYTVADGTGIVKAAKRLKRPLKRRITGIKLMEESLKIANANHQRVYLLGGTSDIVKLAQYQLQNRYPHIVFDSHHGYINLNDETVLKRIKNFDPDYLFIGMGFPRQDEWISLKQKHFNKTVMMGVGGALEVQSGIKKRAPKLFRRLNIEWIYRFLIDWKRIGRLKVIPKFMIKILLIQRKEKRKK